MSVAAQVGENPTAWDRCRRAGVSRELTAPLRFSSASETEERRRRNPLSSVAAPVSNALRLATSRDHVLILTDAIGNVITRSGTAIALDAAGRIGFEEGAQWSEASVGTNAISEALRLSEAAYVSGEGHFAYSHASWTCMAAPIYSPGTGALLGVLDVSGPRDQLDQDVVSMVRMTALLTRRGGTIVFNGLPPGEFPAPIFDIVLKGLTIRGSIVGTRQDMVEALDFYARGLIHPTYSKRPLGDVNAVLDEMHHGKIDGRVVIDYGA